MNEVTAQFVEATHKKMYLTGNNSIHFHLTTVKSYQLVVFFHEDLSD